MYEVNKEILNNIKTEFCEELDERRYPFKSHAISTIINTWLERKAPLLELLSKHPKWNPERLMIHFDEDYSRKIDKYETGRFLNWLRSRHAIPYVVDVFIERYCLTNSHLPINEELDEFLVSELAAIDKSLSFHAGEKVTRVVNRICTYYGWDKKEHYYKCTACEEELVKETRLIEVEPGVLVNKTVWVCPRCGFVYNKVIDYNTEFAKYCDAISPIKTTRHTCVSVNPLDYLLMSHGNSWDSCHYIRQHGNGGMYCSGTISYMLDSTSIIFYTVGADFDKDSIELEPKLLRQVFGYHDYQLVQSRLYPQGNDCGAEAIYTDIRNIMQKVVADCLGVPNRWIKKARIDNVCYDDKATAYSDLGNTNCSLSILKGKDPEELDELILGAVPICIECGEEHGVEDNITCCDSGRLMCCNCGNMIDEDEVCYVNGCAYCEDCVSYCDSCEEYTTDSTTEVRGGNYVCDHCLAEYYRWCECCGEYVYEDDATWVESEMMYVCDECLERDFERCDECDEYHRRDDMHEVVNSVTGEVSFYCDDCYEEEEEDEDNE